MALYYKTKGMNLHEALMGLYEKYGYFREKLINIEMEGKDGQDKIRDILEYLRHSMSWNVGDAKIVKKMDYKLSIEKDLVKIEENEIDLPKTNTLKFVLEDDSSFVVRPSGTEPKMKVYLSVKGSSLEDAEERIASLEKNVMDIIYPRG